jgi:organic radical activating enzyme
LEDTVILNVHIVGNMADQILKIIAQQNYVLRTIDSIKEQARNRGFNSFHFSLSGGEPTLHPGYFDILKRLADDVEKHNLYINTYDNKLSKSWSGSKNIHNMQKSLIEHQ